jgi:perosamine synthetase
MINIASPMMGNEEIDAVDAVLRSGLLAQGPKVAQLEEDFAKYCGTKYAVAVSNGTAALHSALFAAGVEPGDEVITTPFTFVATVNAILFLGAKPVLVDIDPTSFNISTDLLEKAITPKTKAILPVHLYGQPCDYDEIAAIASRHSLIVIEDACQAVGATYKDKKAGNLGDMACFSLYATKNITSGEGGIVTTNNKEYAETIRRFRQNGMNGPYEYQHIGYNYRLTDIQAAIACRQLERIEGFTQKRISNAAKLNAELAGIKGLIVPLISDSRTHVFHQYTVRLTAEFPLSREDLIVKLRDSGIATGVYYPKPLHFYDHIAKIGYKEGDFPKAELAASQVLSLPVHQKVENDDIQHMARIIRGFTDSPRR